MEVPAHSCVHPEGELMDDSGDWGCGAEEGEL